VGFDFGEEYCFDQARAIVQTAESLGIGAEIEAERLVAEVDATKGQFEFQMLHGVRRDWQQRLTRDGYRVRVYVPYGTQWYPYFMRRLAERPANVLLMARAFVGK